MIFFYYNNFVVQRSRYSSSYWYTKRLMFFYISFIQLFFFTVSQNLATWITSLDSPYAMWISFPTALFVNQSEMSILVTIIYELFIVDVTLRCKLPLTMNDILYFILLVLHFSNYTSFAVLLLSKQSKTAWLYSATELFVKNRYIQCGISLPLLWKKIAIWLDLILDWQR